MTENKQQKIELVRKFEIAVFEEDVKDDGSVQWNQVSYKQPVIVEARNPAELNSKLDLYKQCGQKAKVVREVDPPTKEQIEAYVNQMKQSSTATVIKDDKKEAKLNDNNSNLSKVDNEIAKASTTTEQHTTIKKASKPKFYKVGDIEIKDDNGKIYQKQWMKLSDSEASNIRLVNDKNNSLVNIANKHFEMKKWVLVQTSEEDESSQLEENLK